VRPPCRPDVHFHCCVIEGVFVAGADGQVQFAEAAALRPEGLAAVLRWFARAGHLDAADARDMASWDRGGGFALDASGRIEGPDRAGLTAAAALLRPPFALERLEQASDDELIYRFRPPPHCTPPSARRRATHRRELTQARFAGRPATLSPPAPANPTACVELRGGV
jgi:hypothetical protein